MFGPSLLTQFEIIDDHDIIAHLGINGAGYSWQQFMAELRGTTYIEQNGRFRPLLYIIKGIQIWLFQNTPLLWHLAELGFVLATALFFYAAFFKLLPAPLAALATILAFCGIHAESWLRLLTTEAWGMFFFAGGLCALIPSKKDMEFPSVNFLVGMLGLWLAALTKESFIPLLPLCLLFCFFVCPRLNIGNYALGGCLKKRSTRLLLFLILLGTVFHGTAMVAALRGLGYRYLIMPYQQRWFTFNEGTRDWFWKSGWIIPVAILAYELVLFCECRFKPTRNFWREQKTVVFIAAANVLIWFLPQWIVYGNVVRFLQHYMLPINLFVVFMVVLYLREMLNKSHRLGSYGISAIFLLFLIFFECTWIFQTHQYAKKRAVASHSYQSWLGTLVKERQDHPNSAFVICSGVGYFEHMSSIVRYLQHYLKRDERPYLSINWKEMYASPNDPLVEQLRVAEQSGSADFSARPEKLDTTTYLIGIQIYGSERSCAANKIFQMDTFDI